MAAPSAFSHPGFRHVSYPGRIHAGDNALERLGEESDRARARRILIVCGQMVAHRTNLLDRVKQALGDKLAGVFEGVRGVLRRLPTPTSLTSGQWLRYAGRKTPQTQ